MSVVPLLEVLTFSACDPAHPAQNLLSASPGSGAATKKSRRWLSNRGQEVMEAEIRFAPSTIEAVDLGNYWSSTVRLEVGRSGEPTSSRRALLETKVLMSRGDCQSGANAEAMRFYGRGDLNPEAAECRWWDRLRVVCRQPHGRGGDVFGLSVLVIKGRPRGSREGENAVYQQPKTIFSSPSRSHTASSGLDVLIERAARQIPSSSSSSSSSSSTSSLTPPRPSFRAHLFRRRARQLFAAKDPERSLSAEKLQKLWYQNFPERLGERERREMASVAESYASEAAGTEASTKAGISGSSRRDVSPAVLALRAMENVSDPPSVAGKRDGRNALSVTDILMAKHREKKAKKYEDKPEVSVSSLEQRGADSRKVTFTSNKTLPLKRSSEGRDKKLHICAGSEVHFLRSGAGCCYAFHRQELHELDLSRKQEEKVFGKKNEDSGSNDDVVECPLCSRRFSAAEIARHCDGCGGGDQDDIGSQAGPSSSSTSSCPVCGEAIRAEDLPSHAPACAERLFG